MRAITGAPARRLVAGAVAAEGPKPDPATLDRKLRALDRKKLKGLDDGRWGRALEPLAEAFAQRFRDFLPIATYPVRVGIPVADLTAGLYCSLGIMVALLAREETGKGQWVQTSLLQAQIAMLDFQAARWLMDGEIPKQAGNNHPTSIPTGVFKTSDGYINIATTGGRIWERCAQAIGAPSRSASRTRLRGRAMSRASPSGLMRCPSSMSASVVQPCRLASPR